MPTGVYEHKPQTEERKRIHREATTKCWRDPEYRKKVVEAMKGKVGVYERTEEHRKKIKEGQNRSEVRIANSEAKKKNWKNSEYRESQIKAIVKGSMKASHIKPNKTELRLNGLLQRILPTEYKYVGDGKFILANKCPDFVNVNGQKKIIELYGNYWHRGETGIERIALFRQYGFDTLIVWEDELKDEGNLKEKLLNFNEVKL